MRKESKLHERKARRRREITNTRNSCQEENDGHRKIKQELRAERWKDALVHKTGILSRLCSGVITCILPC